MSANTKPLRLEDRIREACRVRHYSLSTERTYVSWYRQFVRWAGLKHPATLGGDRVEAWLSHLATDREVAASTQRQALAAILFLYRQVLGMTLPWLDNVTRAKQPQRLPPVRNERHRYVTRAEFLPIARAIAHLETRALALVAFYSGMRFSECLRAEPTPAGWLLTDTKNGDRRIVPIHAKVAHIARRWPREISASTAGKWWRYAADRCGHEGLRFHDLRHSAASLMIQAGVPLYTVGAVLGHKATASTKRYSHLDTSTLAEAVARIGRRGVG